MWDYIGNFLSENIVSIVDTKYSFYRESPLYEATRNIWGYTIYTEGEADGHG